MAQEIYQGAINFKLDFLLFLSKYMAPKRISYGGETAKTGGILWPL